MISCEINYLRGGTSPYFGLTIESWGKKYLKGRGKVTQLVEHQATDWV
jgi:hypothetical protein